MTFKMCCIPEGDNAKDEVDDADEFKEAVETSQKSVEEKATEMIETAYNSYLKLLKVCSTYTNEQQIMGNARDNEMKKLKAANLIYKHILNPEEAKKAYMRAEEARIMEMAKR